jgi:uncharacterized protein (TIGR04255 family)
MTSRPQLPYSPLGEVVIELKFSGDFVWKEAWAGLQSKIRGEFPKMLVPQVSAGEAVALKPVQLVAEDDGEVVSLAINSFAFSTKRYQTYGEFRKRFVQIFDIVAGLYLPPAFTRVGLRYLNWLPSEFPKSEKSGQLHPGLTLGITGAPAGEMHNPQVLFVVKNGEHMLRVALLPDENLAHNAGQEMGSKLLDFDGFVAAKKIDIDGIMPILDRAHEMIDDAFFGMLTPEFLAYLNGGG